MLDERAPVPRSDPGGRGRGSGGGGGTRRCRRRPCAAPGPWRRASGDTNKTRMDARITRLCRKVKSCGPRDHGLSRSAKWRTRLVEHARRDHAVGVVFEPVPTARHARPADRKEPAPDALGVRRGVPRLRARRPVAPGQRHRAGSPWRLPRFLRCLGPGADGVARRTGRQGAGTRPGPGGRRRGV